MCDYNFSTLISDLSKGREVEFIYKKKTYSILQSSEGWIFICNNEKKSNYYWDVTELINNILIENASLKDIFNSYKFDTHELTIY